MAVARAASRRARQQAAAVPGCCQHSMKFPRWLEGSLVLQHAGHVLAVHAVKLALQDVKFLQMRRGTRYERGVLYCMKGCRIVLEAVVPVLAGCSSAPCPLPGTVCWRLVRVICHCTATPLPFRNHANRSMTAALQRWAQGGTAHPPCPHAAGRPRAPQSSGHTCRRVYAGVRGWGGSLHCWPRAAGQLSGVRSNLRPPLNSCMLCRHARGCTLGGLLSRPRGGGSSAHMPLAMCVGSGAAAQW